MVAGSTDIVGEPVFITFYQLNRCGQDMLYPVLGNNSIGDILFINESSGITEATPLVNLDGDIIEVHRVKDDIDTGQFPVPVIFGQLISSETGCYDEIYRLTGSDTEIGISGMMIELFCADARFFPA